MLVFDELACDAVECFLHGKVESKTLSISSSLANLEFHIALSSELSVLRP